uniref:Uncharacterized protein n=1 Tax=Arundo donax TaxID=35708 RepID=A0A0A9FME9_ARUDO
MHNDQMPRTSKEGRFTGIYPRRLIQKPSGKLQQQRNTNLIHGSAFWKELSGK